MHRGLVPICLLLSVTHALCAAGLRSDEQVLLYPAIGRPASAGWALFTQGVVFEPERQRLLVPVLTRAMGFDPDELTAAERQVLRERLEYFFADNERGKELSLRLNGVDYPLGMSAANGQFRATIRVEQQSWPHSWAPTNLAVRCHLTSPGAPARPITLEVHLLTESGLSVISDIDDTIKISDIRDRQELLRNTFLRPFQAAPQMAELYQQWHQAGLQFHYVTASPWQLYVPLSEFVRSNGFPAGTFHMKNARLKDGSFLDLLQPPEEYKLPLIEALFAQLPQRAFILVGDSGEKDPEIYATLARKYPQRVRLVLIRNVTDQARDSNRYRETFKDIPAERWQIFKVPTEIKQGVLSE